MLTVVGVQVDLSVWVDLHCCPLWQLGNSAFNLGVNQQMVMLVDAFELLSDGHLLTALQESDLSLPRELSAYVQTNMNFRPNGHFFFCLNPPKCPRSLVQTKIFVIG